MKLFTQGSLLNLSLLTPLFAIALGVPSRSLAQSKPDDFYAESTFKVFHLANVSQDKDADAILVAIRNMVNPRDKIYLLTTTNDIVVAAPPEEQTRIGQLVAELDRPKHAYRLTYTLAESDNGKRVGVQHFSMVVLLSQRVQLKQGDKIPVVTGSFNTDQKAEQTQFTYLDVGLNLDSTIDQFAGGLRLRSIVEQSSIAAEHGVGVLADEPIVRQSKLEATSVILPGKPLILGGIDIVGSTRHLDVEVVAEPLP